MTTQHSIPGANVMLVGGIGSGKTHAIRTLIEAGITPFVLFTEPGMRTLSDIPPDKLHWQYIPAATSDWDTMIDSAKKINTMSYQALTKLGDINKRKFSQFLSVLGALHNFTCDRTGEWFGDVSYWGPERAIVVDSLSGLNRMAMDLVVGSKPTKAMSDWGIAMDTLERLVDKLCYDTKCHFILTAHLEREQDEVTGAIRNMPGTLGRKLAPRLPRNFDDVVLCEHKPPKWTWSTISMNTDLKARNLSQADNLLPSFVPLIESWKSAGGIIPSAEEEVKPAKPITETA